MFRKQGLCYKRNFVSDLAGVIPIPTSLCGSPFAYAALRVSPELLLGFLLCFICLWGIMFLDLQF